MRTLRDFLFTFFIAVLIFSVAAFFLYNSIDGLMGDLVDKINSNPAVVSTADAEPANAPAETGESGEQPTEKTDDIVTFCVVGLDHSKLNADVIYLLAVNATKKEMTVAFVPSNTYVADRDLKLSELYASGGVRGIQNYLALETGLETDFYAVFTRDGFSNMIDFLGGMNYSVPETIHYFDPAQDLKIDLAAGNQLLDGQQAAGLLAYRDYGDAKRQDTLISFARAFVTTFLRSSNITVFKNIYYNVVYHVSTDFTSNDFNNYADWIFAADTYTVNVRRIPGAADGGYYQISQSNSAALFDHFKK